jgi:hypothetical protein
MASILHGGSVANSSSIGVWHEDISILWRLHHVQRPPFRSFGDPAVRCWCLSYGSTFSRRLVSDPRVNAISFTGSSEVGKQIYATASARLAAVQCEMGGKDAVVILADADLHDGLCCKYSDSRRKTDHLTDFRRRLPRIVPSVKERD